MERELLKFEELSIGIIVKSSEGDVGIIINNYLKIKNYELSRRISKSIKAGNYIGPGDGGLVRNGEKELREAYEIYKKTGTFDHLDKFKNSGIKKKEID